MRVFSEFGDYEFLCVLIMGLVQQVVSVKIYNTYTEI